jgi:hypothetical protein
MKNPFRYCKYLVILFYFNKTVKKNNFKKCTEDKFQRTNLLLYIKQ